MLNRLFKKTLLLGAVAVLLSSCGEESAPPPPLKKASVKPAAAAPGADKTAGISATAADTKLRNPFLSFIIVRQDSEGTDKKAIRGPLQCCELMLFKIQALMTSGKKPKALILAPDGKRYMVGLGDIIGAQDGKIIKIDEYGMMVREYTKDSDGKIILINDVAVKMHPDKDQAKQ